MQRKEIAAMPKGFDFIQIKGKFERNKAKDLSESLVEPKIILNFDDQNCVENDKFVSAKENEDFSLNLNAIDSELVQKQNLSDYRQAMRIAKKRYFLSK